MIIGAALWNDFKVLKTKQTSGYTIDVSMLQPIRSLMGQKGFFRNGGNFGLKQMARELLGSKIQDSCHCSIEDATTAMKLFHLVEKTYVKDNNEHLYNFFENREVNNQTRFRTSEYY